MAMPDALPMPNCSASWLTSMDAESEFPNVMASMSIMVSIYAMGSFEPLSSSRSGRRLFFNPTFWDPNMPNTDAESVDDIVDASRSEGMKAKWILVQEIPESQKMNKPVIREVRSTPMVESMIPEERTGRIEDTLVDMPPENSMMQRAIMPMNWASCMLLNCSPRPSVPKSIPTIRNTRSNGSPVR